MNQMFQPLIDKTAQSRLVDPFGRSISYLRVSVTDRCDFRCVYCMAEDMTFLPKRDLLSLDELDRMCSAFIDKGVKKLRPTWRRSCPVFCLRGKPSRWLAEDETRSCGNWFETAWGGVMSPPKRDRCPDCHQRRHREWCKGHECGYRLHQWHHSCH
jgi:hypothetical protein